MLKDVLIVKLLLSNKCNNLQSCGEIESMHEFEFYLCKEPDNFQSTKASEEVADYVASWVKKRLISNS